MSQNRIVFEGLDELRKALRELPETLTQEAAGIVDKTADEAVAEIIAAYPERAGALRNGVRKTHFEGGRFSAGAIVKSSAPHAWMFENGTQARHTAIGANRGSMPPGHVFLPIVIRKRFGMYGKLKAMLVRVGLIVSD